MRALFVGFGDLARRTSALLVADGWQVCGLKRSPERIDGVEVVSGDCRDDHKLAQLIDGQDLVVVTLTPDEYSEAGYQRAYVEPAEALERAIARLDEGAGVRPGRVLWVSSTSVYGQGNGEWVDEDTVPNPTAYSGRALLAAEQSLHRSPVPATIVRFSGIYGRGNGRLLEQVLAGNCAPAAPVQWSNRIHADDCAGILAFLARRHRLGEPLEPLYLGTDTEPVPLHDVHCWLAQQLGVSPGFREGRSGRGNRRCSSRRLIESGYNFRYPTFRDGYRALVDQYLAAKD